MRRFLPLIVLIALMSGCVKPGFYVVRPGDTLYSIAWRFNQEYRDLAAWNHLLPPYILYDGQILKVVGPPGEGAVEQAQAPTPEKSPSQAKAPAQRRRAAHPPRKPAPVVGDIGWHWPVSQGKIVRRYTRKQAGRQGVDISGNPGQPVLAAASGRVVYSGSGLRGYGKLIIVKHNSAFLSAYAHNRALLVKEGAEVKGGQQIAEMGRTGAKRTMLHFEIRRQGKAVDPERYLPQGVIN